MAKHIGIAAVSAPGAALCYETICREAPARMGRHAHPEITMHAFSFAEHVRLMGGDDWEAVAELMLGSAEKLAGAGADFAVCPDNTAHKPMGLVRTRSPIPWLHIAEVVADEARRGGFRRLGILGTRHLMESEVYTEAAASYGISCDIPEPVDRERINDIIFEQLVNGLFPEESRLYFNDVIARLKQRGCDAAVLGCTEIPLIVRPDDVQLPTLDSTRLLAKAALNYALEA
jgi:aspartate racemase